MRAVKASELVGVEEKTKGLPSPGSISPTAMSPSALSAASPDPEVLERPVRRRFTAEYKLRILRLADACGKSGDLGALLRREGLYASNLTTWRHQREEGTLAGLMPKKRGRKEVARNPLQADNEKLQKENERLTNRLKRAELIIDVQKKISLILGIPMSEVEEGKD